MYYHNFWTSSWRILYHTDFTLSRFQMKNQFNLFHLFLNTDHYIIGTLLYFTGLIVTIKKHIIILIVIHI